MIQLLRSRKKLLPLIFDYAHVKTHTQETRQRYNII